MGGNVIGALIFILISMLLISHEDVIVSHNIQTAGIYSYIQEEAQELNEFSQAAYNYTETLSPNNPLSVSNMSVSNLQSLGLLPESFPQETPFGQTFQADFVQDSCNQNVIDLLVRTSGGYNSDLMAKAGLQGALGESYINSNVDNELSKMNLSYSNISNPCLTNGPGFYIGSLTGTNFNIYGNNESIPSNVSANNNDAGIYIYAPNQKGFMIVTYANEDSLGANGGSSADVWPNSVGLWAASVPGQINLSIKQWSYACPSNALNYNNYNSSSYSQAITGYSSTILTNLSYTYCIPSYKSQAVIVENLPVNTQIFNPLDPYYTMYNYTGDDATGNIYATTPTGGWAFYNTATYLTSPNSDLSGLNNNVFGATSFFGNTMPSYPSPDSDFIFPEPMDNYISALGFSVEVGGNIYQFGAYNYDFFTGQGESPAALGGLTLNANGQYCNNDPNGVQCYPLGATIWATGISSNQNLGTSTENVGAGYFINVNPANTNDINVTSQYKQNNGATAQNFSFNIPTPLVTN